MIGKDRNDPHEAYTGNIAGRRGDVPPLSNSASLMKKMQLATALTSEEARTEESNKCKSGRDTRGEIPEELPESESVACNERSIRNLGDPFASLYELI